MGQPIGQSHVKVTFHFQKIGLLHENYLFIKEIFSSTVLLPKVPKQA
jgi:hypothetical protein